jgi:hypothetical protein
MLAIVTTVRISQNGLFITSQFPNGTYKDDFLLDASLDIKEGMFAMFHDLTSEPIMIVETLGGEPVWPTQPRKTSEV